MSMLQCQLVEFKLNFQPDGSIGQPLSNAAVESRMKEIGAPTLCPNAIQHAIVQTVQGRLWYPRIRKVGRPVGLSEADQPLFEENIRNAMHEVNCVTTFQARAIAFINRTARDRLPHDLLSIISKNRDFSW
jgi:hypothetical protein